MSQELTQAGQLALASLRCSGELDTVLDMVLYYTDTFTGPADWFRVNRDLQQVFGVDRETARSLIWYFKHNQDILYEQR